jgi:hypothetical protein
MKTFTEKQIVDLYHELKQPPYHDMEPGILQFLDELGVTLPQDKISLEVFTPFKSVICKISQGGTEAISGWPNLIKLMAQYILAELEKAGEHDSKS